LDYRTPALPTISLLTRGGHRRRQIEEENSHVQYRRKSDRNHRREQRYRRGNGKALGAKVVLGARRTDRLETIAGEIRADGGTAEFKALDVTNRENVDAFVQFADKTFGKVDVIVNNAGLMPLSPMQALKVAEWTAWSTSTSKACSTASPPACRS
jgi:hypothetical protein